MNRTSSEIFIDISEAIARIGAAETAHGTNSVQHREALNRRDLLTEEYRAAKSRERTEAAA